MSTANFYCLLCDDYRNPKMLCPSSNRPWTKTHWEAHIEAHPLPFRNLN